MIKIVPAEEKHYGLIRSMAKVAKLSKWPELIYKLVLVLAVGYGMIILYKDKPAGFLFAIPLLGAVFVHQIAVLPKFRRKGLGSKMLDKVHDKKVYLIPREKAKKWYLGKGYKETWIPWLWESPTSQT